MTTTSPVVGIDFGNTQSGIAWFDPRTRVARIVSNSAGDARTPSLVHYGDDAIQVGGNAEQLLRDEAERVRILSGVKRDLAKPIRYSLGIRELRPVDVVADILQQLKRDVEQGQGAASVGRAVVTHPPEMDQLECDLLEQAAQTAGFTEVILLPEPVAAAIAITEAGAELGERVLVYDLGGSTCSVSLLERGNDPAYDLAAETRYMRCGGDDLDRALYDHFEEIVQEVLNRSIGSADRRDLGFLVECRACKERLSAEDEVELGFRWSDGVQFSRPINREVFESLVESALEPTTRLATQLLAEGGGEAAPDSVVMIGGTSWVPHVQRLVRDALGIEPIVRDDCQNAVALGAAAYAGSRWIPGSERSGATDAGIDLRAQVEAAFLGVAPSNPSNLEDRPGPDDLRRSEIDSDSEFDDRLLRQVNAALNLSVDDGSRPNLSSPQLGAGSAEDLLSQVNTALGLGDVERQPPSPDDLLGQVEAEL